MVTRWAGQAQGIAPTRNRIVCWAGQAQGIAPTNEMSQSAPARTQPNPRQRKRRRRLLRALLLRFLKRLRKACAVLETPAQWYELTKELRQTLNDYADVLGSADRDSLWLATLLADSTHEGITRACSVLQSKLVTVISALPAGGLAAPLLLGAALVVAAAVAGAAILLNALSVTVNLHNVGCVPIAIAGNLPVTLPGVDLPPFVATNAVERATVPPVSMTTDFHPPNTLSVNLFGVPLSFQFPPDVQSVTFDGVDLTTGRRVLDFGRGAQHDFVVRCQ
ncbi:MAG: hypothetical protein HY741_18880 [Chloroflexi bacterium]|nr:hypothetical protein [Chloroflexota bacterium]